jgi:hypothetical protein
MVNMQEAKSSLSRLVKRAAGAGSVGLIGGDGTLEKCERFTRLYRTANHLPFFRWRPTNRLIAC